MTSDLPGVIAGSGLIAPGERVLCALSGGADSTALLFAMCALRVPMRLRVAAAHFHHGLRGSEADEDEAFAASLCASLEVPLFTGHGDAAARARLQGESTEQAARALRYAFFDTLSCDKLAIAHTADDNAETVLLNLIRGTGPRGLAGIPPQRGRIVRPLLGVTRAEIEAYLRQNGLSFRQDSTNNADDALRNRIRHFVLPLCKAENPAFLTAVSHTAQLVRQDCDTLRLDAFSALTAAAADGGWRVSPLASLPASQRRRAMYLLLTQQHIPRLTRQHVLALDALLCSPNPSARIDLPGGLCARREYGLLVFSAPQPAAFTERPLCADGVTVLPELGLKLLCAPARECVNTPWRFTVVPAGPVTVRPRRTGDVLTGSGGTKTLKKRMIDCKIPRVQRDRLPVFADVQGVLAVGGLGANLRRVGMDHAVTIQILTMEDQEL